MKTFSSLFRLGVISFCLTITSSTGVAGAVQAIPADQSISVVQGTTKYHGTAISTAPIQQPTLAYNCAKLPSICENVARHFPVNRSPQGNPQYITGLQAAGGVTQMYYDKSSGRKKWRRARACPSGWNTKAANLCPMPNQPLVVANPSNPQSIRYTVSNGFPGRRFYDNNNKRPKSAKRNQIALPNGGVSTPMMWSCDEFPAATFVGGGTWATEICAPQASKCNSQEGLRIEQDFQASAHQRLSTSFSDDTVNAFQFTYPDDYATGTGVGTGNVSRSERSLIDSRHWRGRSFHKRNETDLTDPDDNGEGDDAGSDTGEAFCDLDLGHDWNGPDEASKQVPPISVRGQSPTPTPTPTPAPTPVPATATVMAGTSPVHVGTLTGDALYTSVSSALEQICPTAAPTGFTGCTIDTVTVPDIRYVDGDSLEEGELTVKVPSSSYNLTTLRDAMIHSAALAAQNSAQGNNCYKQKYEISVAKRDSSPSPWAPSSWLPSFLAKREGFFPEPEEGTFCNAASFAGVEYWGPWRDIATPAATDHLYAELGFIVAPGGDFLCDFLDLLLGVLGVVQPEFIVDEIPLAGAIAATCGFELDGGTGELIKVGP